MRSIPKCQSQNPELCIHPDCPERKGIREALQNAKSYNEYEAAMKLQEADNERVRLAKIKISEASNNVAPVIALPKAPSPAMMGGKVNEAVKREQIQALIRSDIQRYQANIHEGHDKRPIVRFHEEIGFPWHFKPVTATVPLQYSNHALEEARNDRYSDIPVMKSINLGDAQLVEVKYDQRTGQIAKMLYRKKNVAEGLDACLVIVPPQKRNEAWKVVTTWFNESNDKHKSLNRANYATPKPRQQSQVLKQAA